MSVDRARRKFQRAQIDPRYPYEFAYPVDVSLGPVAQIIEQEHQNLLLAERRVPFGEVGGIKIAVREVGSGFERPFEVIVGKLVVQREFVGRIRSLDGVAQ